jgi:hypothetical protein
MLRPHTIALLLAAVSMLATTHAYAVQRTHVSAAFGDDANTATNCTPVAPCRTFQKAMTVTDPNGEVVVLDSGGYGAVSINQSISLIAPTGVYAGISVFSGASGVSIATPGVNVVLRGLNINGQGGGNGIIMTAGNKLTVENCVISNLGSTGIGIFGDITLRVTDTIIRDNGNSGILLINGAHGVITRATLSGNIGNGIRIEGSLAGSTTTADIADTTVDGNTGTGVFAFSNNGTAVVNVSVHGSRAVRNASSGIAANAGGGTASLSASNNIVSNNNNGISAQNPGAKVWASGNTVSHNTLAGLRNNAGDLFETTGNNAVRNNGTNKVGTITVIPAE